MYICSIIFIIYVNINKSNSLKLNISKSVQTFDVFEYMRIKNSLYINQNYFFILIDDKIIWLYIIVFFKKEKIPMSFIYMDWISISMCLKFTIELCN